MNLSGRQLHLTIHITQAISHVLPLVVLILLKSISELTTVFTGKLVLRKNIEITSAW